MEETSCQKDKKRKELCSLFRDQSWTETTTKDENDYQQVLDILQQFPALAAEEFTFFADCCNNNNNNDNDRWNPLMFLIAANAPLEIIQQVYNLYPQVGQISGNSPLHLACDVYARNLVVTAEPSHTKRSNENCQKVIAFLLKKCPPQILTQKNSEGKLPIHCLLQVQAAPPNNNNNSLEMIQWLMDPHPETHQIRSSNKNNKNDTTAGLLPLEQALLYDYPNSVIQYLAENFASSRTMAKEPTTPQVLHILGSFMDPERIQLLCPLLSLVEEIDIRVGHWASRQAFVTMMQALVDHKDTILRLTFYGLPGRIMEQTRETRDLVPNFLLQAAPTLQELTVSPGGIALGGDHTPEFAAIVNSICRISDRTLHTLRLYNFEVGFLQPVLKLLSNNTCVNLKTIELDCCDIELVDPDSWEKVLHEFSKESSLSDNNHNNNYNYCESLLLSIDHTDMHRALIGQVVASNNMPHLKKLALNPCFIDQEEYPDWSVQWFELLERSFSDRPPLSVLRMDLFGIVQPVSLLQYLASSCAPSEVIVCDLQLKRGGWDNKDALVELQNIVWDDSPVESLTLSIKDVDGDYDYLKDLLFEIVQQMPRLRELNLKLSDDESDNSDPEADPDPDMAERIQDIFRLAKDSLKPVSA